MAFSVSRWCDSSLSICRLPPQRGEQLVDFLPQRFHVGVGQGRIDRGDGVAVGRGTPDGGAQVRSSQAAWGRRGAGLASRRVPAA